MDKGQNPVDISKLLKKLAKQIQKTPELNKYLEEVVATLKVNALLNRNPLTPFTPELEAIAITAYAVRNSDIVETTLHSKGQRLTDKLMPEFTGEIAYRMALILGAKEHLMDNGLGELWILFVRAYHGHFCSSWQFYIPPPPKPFID